MLRRCTLLSFQPQALKQFSSVSIFHIGALGDAFYNKCALRLRRLSTAQCALNLYYPDIGARLGGERLPICFLSLPEPHGNDIDARCEKIHNETSIYFLLQFYI